MNITYTGSFVAVPTGRFYPILSMYNVTNNRRYAREQMVRSQTDGPLVGESI